MIWFICIGISILITGCILGWKARTWKDDFDDDIDRIFYEAWKNLE